jgi:hypothetical protein
MASRAAVTIPAFPGRELEHVRLCSLLPIGNGALQRPECSLLAMIGMPILPSRSHHQIPEPSLQHRGDTQRQATSPPTTRTTSPSPPFHSSAPPHSPPSTHQRPSSVPVVLASSCTIMPTPRSHLYHPLPYFPPFQLWFRRQSGISRMRAAVRQRPSPDSMTAIHVWANAPSLRAQ